MRVRVLILALCVLAICSCKRSPAPPPATKSAPTAIFVGGLGWNQLHSIMDALAALRPDVNIVNMGDNNAWMNSPADWGNANPHGKLVLIGHSFGCDTAMRDAARIGDVECAVLMDPVAHGAGNSQIRIPLKIKNVYVYRATESTIGVNPAWLHGTFWSTEVTGAHSEICHNPEVVAEIAGRLAEALK